MESSELSIRFRTNRAKEKVFKEKRRGTFSVGKNLQKERTIRYASPDLIDHGMGLMVRTFNIGTCIWPNYFLLDKWILYSTTFLFSYPNGNHCGHLAVLGFVGNPSSLRFRCYLCVTWIRVCMGFRLPCPIFVSTFFWMTLTIHGAILSRQCFPKSADLQNR